MVKYLLKAAYTSEGTKGLLREGGSKRVATVRKMIEDQGGKLEAFYYAFGGDDAVLILEVPDSVSAVALSMTVNATGAVQCSMTPLISAQEIDQACEMSIKYREPGA